MSWTVCVDILEDFFYFVVVNFQEISLKQPSFNLLIIENPIIIGIKFPKSIKELHSLLTGQQLWYNISMHDSLQFIFELNLWYVSTWKFDILWRISSFYLLSGFELFFFYFIHGFYRAYLAVGRLFGSLLRSSLVKSRADWENFVL